MTALDVIVIAVLGGGAIFGFIRGFVEEVLALTVWLLILFLTRIGHAPLTVWLTQWLGTEGGGAVAAFIVIVGAVYVFGRMAVREIGRRSRSSVLGPVDRVLGFGFGIVKGLAILSLLFLLVILANETIFGEDADRPEWMTQSRTYPLLNATGSALTDFLEEQREGSREEKQADDAGSAQGE